MAIIKSFRELEVWKKGILLVKELYILTDSFPSSELYGLTSQIRRAGVSVPANIAEGWGRELTKNYIQFLRISKGSIFEIDTLITIASDLGYLTTKQREKTGSELNELGKMLTAMIKKLSEKLNH
jgi:four helix bundle protein